MTADDMQAYINDLSRSGRQQGLDKNFGVGAKITAGVRNPHGLVYFSWKDDQGAAVQFWRDPDSQVYGLRQFESPEGSFAHWRPVPDEAKPVLIERSGTMVVLLGADEGDNTAVCPMGGPYPSHWLARYLNTRYFRFPEGVRVRVREFARREASQWPASPTGAMAEGSQLREVRGQGFFLERSSQARGTVVLEDAVAHWWLLRDDDSLRVHRDSWQASGHVAALYQDELYDMRVGPAGQRVLQQFGVLFGARRVVVYLESSPKDGALAANTARSELLVNGRRLPWERWAEQFRQRMPREIQDMMNAILEGVDAKSHREAISQRLQSVRELFDLPRYRRADDGPVSTDGSAGGLPVTGGGSQTGKSPVGQRGGRKGDLYGDIVRHHGHPARPIRPAIIEPSVQWVRSQDHTREPGQMEDRAAQYLPEYHKLLVNGDFRVFEDMVWRWTSRYETMPGAPNVDPLVRTPIFQKGVPLR
jgi:hypothetical protein